MIIKEIICDRCGAKIEGEKPARIQLQEYDYTESKSYGRYAKGYRTTHTAHLCMKCGNDLDRFMAGAVITDAD